MKRVFENGIIEKYCAECEDIKTFCSPVEYVDYTNKNHYLYDFDDGYAALVDMTDCYLVSCGFVKARQNGDAFKKCKSALDDFHKTKKDIPILALVTYNNKPSSFLLNALGFVFTEPASYNGSRDRFKLYEYGG